MTFVVKVTPVAGGKHVKVTNASGKIDLLLPIDDEISKRLLPRGTYYCMGTLSRKKFSMGRMVKYQLW
jgi:hypothetical protein